MGIQNQNIRQAAEISLMKNEMMNLTKQVELHHQTHPSVCSSYSELSDEWRKIDYINRRSYSPVHCDQTGNAQKYSNLTQGWYRFTGDAGTKLPTSPAPGTNITGSRMICGTHMVGWISSGGHPSIQDGIVTREVSWEWMKDDAWSNKKTIIKVAACRDWGGDYFVYELQPTSTCHLGYCALD